MIRRFKIQNLVNGIIQIQRSNQIHYEANYRHERAILKAQDMHVVGNLFGLRVVEGCNPSPCVELYVEDDENYYYKTSFAAIWLKDLEMVSSLLHNFFRRKNG